MALAMVLAWNTAIGRKTITEVEFIEPIRKQPKQTSTWKMEKVEEPVVKEVVVEQEQKLKPRNLPKGGISAT